MSRLFSNFSVINLSTPVAYDTELSPFGPYIMALSDRETRHYLHKYIEKNLIKALAHTENGVQCAEGYMNM